MSKLTEAAAYAGSGILGLCGLPVGNFIDAGKCLFDHFGRGRKLEKLVLHAAAQAEQALPEGLSDIDREPLRATLCDLVAHHALSPAELADVAFDAEQAAAKVMAKGAGRIEAEHVPVVTLALKRLYAAYLEDPQTRQDLVFDALEVLLKRSAELANLLGDVAEALRDLQATLLLNEPVVLPPRKAKASPRWLLQPTHAVVPFHPARKEALDELVAWCETDDLAGVRLLHGPGGLGKTRLGMEIARAMRKRGWRTGLLNKKADQAPPGSFERLCKDETPLCVIVDYAETQEPVLIRLLTRAWQSDGKIRVLLLARERAEWFDRLKRRASEVQDLLGSYGSAKRLESLTSSLEVRRALYDAAVEAFAPKLPNTAARAPVPNLAADHFDLPLYIHIAALAALHGQKIEEAEELLNWVVDREQRAWQAAIDADGLSPTLYPAIAEAVALTTLVGGAEHVEGLVEYVGAVPTIRGQPVSTIRAVAGVLAGLYPEPSSLGALTPDLPGEYLVAAELDKCHNLLCVAVQTSIHNSKETVLLTTLTRMTMRQPRHSKWISKAINFEPKALVFSVIQVGLQLGPPIVRVLEELIATSKIENLAQHVRALPYPSTIFSKLSELVESKLAQDKDEDAVSVITNLLHLAISLKDNSNLQKSQQMIEEADHKSRLLLNPYDINHRILLARVLSEQGLIYYYCNKPKDAMKKLIEATLLLEFFITGKYVLCIHNFLIYHRFSLVFDYLKNYSRALSFAQRALDVLHQIYQEPMKEDPKHYSMALHNISLRYSNNCMPHKARLFALKAMRIRLKLMRSNFDRHGKTYATTAAHLADLHAKSKEINKTKMNKALYWGIKAVNIRRKNYEINPEYSAIEYARSLNKLSYIYCRMITSNSNHANEAYDTAYRAIEVLKPHYLRV